MDGHAHRSWLWTNRVKLALGIAIFEGLLVAFEKDFSRITVIVIAVPIILFYLLAGRSVESQLGREISWVLAWVAEAGRPLGPEPLVVVLSPETAEAAGELAGLRVAVQERPRGTGDAVASARGELEGFSGDILVLSGDTPLLTPGLLGDL